MSNQNYMENTRYTIEFMGIWERVSNPDFNLTEFSYIKNESGSNGYVLSAKQWIEKTGAIGIISKAGRYGGTFAHIDIAFEFATWISPELSKQQMSIVYASEADLLNMALFGKTACQWRDENPAEKGNIRDYANVTQLVCLANLENLNAHLIQQNLLQTERIKLLNHTAIQQMRLLTDDRGVQKLQGGTHE